MLIAIVRTLLLRDLASFQQELEAYPDDRLIWAIPPGIANSAGTLALHAAGNLQHFIGARLGGTGYVRDRPAEFGRRDVPSIELVAELARASEAVAAALSTLDPAVLETEHPDSFTNGKKVSVGVLLGHLATHLTYHLGQVDYHRRLVTGQGAIPGVVGVP
ncbi:MAG: DinB family protein [Gemmatimonadota bacterium]|nr:DinB family protein [Gemmatimonadota bacterium]